MVEGRRHKKKEDRGQTAKERRCKTKGPLAISLRPNLCTLHPEPVLHLLPSTLYHDQLAFNYREL